MTDDMRHRDGKPSTLGSLLREWRAVRGVSQLDLSLDTGISQRHLSFIESGRSAPGRETLVAIAEALRVPLRERNDLLLAAGFAPLYAEPALDTPRMRRVMAAARRLLAQQEPYPAMLMDRHWQVVAANDAAPRFFGRFVDLTAWPRPRNLLRLVFDPAGLRPFVQDWARLSATLIARLRREAVAGVLDAQGRRLLADLMAYPDVPRAGAPGSADDDLPMIPITFAKDGVTLSYFSMVATVGTPTTVTAQELRIECMFPADDATERDHLAFLNAGDRP